MREKKGVRGSLGLADPLVKKYSFFSLYLQPGCFFAAKILKKS